MQVVRGDILKDGRGVIFIPVNKKGVMGAGLAKQFADAYPDLVYWYKQYCETGAIDDAICIADQFLFFPTKNHWKEKSDARMIFDRLEYYLMLLGRSHAINELSVPKLGCGLGGLDWKVVRPPIVKQLETFERRYNKRVYLFE